MFFAAPALLLRFTFFCVGIFIGDLPETRYLLLAFYRYFRVILESTVIFLRPWWQPCKSMRKRSNVVLHGVKHAVDQGKDAHHPVQPLPEL